MVRWYCKFSFWSLSIKSHLQNVKSWPGIKSTYSFIIALERLSGAWFYQEQIMNPSGLHSSGPDIVLMNQHNWYHLSSQDSANLAYFLCQGILSMRHKCSEHQCLMQIKYTQNSRVPLVSRIPWQGTTGSSYWSSSFRNCHSFFLFFPVMKRKRFLWPPQKSREQSWMGLQKPLTAQGWAQQSWIVQKICIMNMRAFPWHR